MVSSMCGEMLDGVSEEQDAQVFCTSETTNDMIWMNSVPGH